VNVLITGGAGYIGSHVSRLLIESGHSVVSVDDFSTGLAERIGSESYELKLENPDAESKLASILNEHGIDTVIHFAARKQVGESVEKPELYYKSNIGGLLNLLSAMKTAGVKKMVFSSSAAVYGMPSVEQVDEQSPTNPINPYGQTKLIGEWMIDNAKTWGLSAISLRYFNVAGTGWSDLADKQALNLIPIAISKISHGEPVDVFGDDYQTEDGSCIRDYIHVMDLAKAHIDAISHLKNPGNEVFNVGTGEGSSVFEVLAELKKVSGIDFEMNIDSRRAGDPPKLVASASKIQDSFGWKSEFGLAEIVATAWESRES